MSILSNFNILACNQKYARKNHLKINKTLSKAKNWGDLGTEINFMKDRNDYSKREFSKQWNYCVSLVRKSKKLYYNNLD